MSDDTIAPLKNAVRAFNKHVLNPAMMTLAGRKHRYAAVTVDGKTFDVIATEIIDLATAAPQLSRRRRRAFQQFGIDNFVKVTVAK